MLPRLLRPLVLLLALLAAACGGPSGPEMTAGPRYAGLSCAPFARALTGVDLHGDAADWWDEAEGRYRRTTVPSEGSLLVLSRSGRLPAGHVAVVSQVVNTRTVLVIQANWVRNELDEDQQVLDVSPDNDWTAVRVWWPPVGQLGVHVYAARGFIVPVPTLSHTELVRRATPAAVLASGD